MNAIIIGGGKIGYHLTGTLIEKGYHVSVIEESKEVCRQFANELDVSIIRGDGTVASILEEAGIKKADCVIAVTGRDEDNLVVCQMAKKLYNIKKTIAKVNNPKNEEPLKRLGVDIVLNSTDYISAQLEREIDSDKIKELLPLEDGKTSVYEIIPDDNFTRWDIPLMDMGIPHTISIITIIRSNNDVIIPNGHAVIKKGDKLLILTKAKNKGDVFRTFGINK
jgi:trk system potassium uptake protein TrkA